MLPRPGLREPLDTTAEVETPEHVRFHYRVAGPAKRGLAYLIDLLLRAALLFVAAIAASLGGFSMSEELRRASSGVLLLLLFLLEWGYYVFCEVIWSGVSPGKRALGLRVVSDTGQPLSPASSLLRNLLRTADFLPGGYALGLLVMGRDARFRRIGDLVAGTMVVAEERHRVAEPLQIKPPSSPEEIAGFPERLPLRGEDLDAIELFLRRAGKLSPSRAHELADMVAPIYARRMGRKVRDPQRLLELLYRAAQEKR